MDFQELLNLAVSNKAEAAYEASVSRYNSDLPPPKKLPKSNVQSSGIKKFLEKKKAEEDARAAEARKKKEQLLALRAQNTKNNKKAKIMASRTKDNDFSRIKLTDDEIEAKKKREAELIRKNLAGKVERMKARIEMEEKEKLLPKKRKRKSKNGEHIESHEDVHEEESSGHRDSMDFKKSRDSMDFKKSRDSIDFKKSDDRSLSGKSNGIRKAPKPPPPALSFMELLKIAEQKQHEPLEIIPKKKEEAKPMTKKERRLKEEELQRQRRKQERLLQGPIGLPSKPQSVSQVTNVNKKLSEKNTEKSKNSIVNNVDKGNSKLVQDSSKFKVPKITANASVNKTVPGKDREASASSGKPNVGKLSTNKPGLITTEKSAKINHTNVLNKPSKPSNESISSSKEIRDVKKVIVPKKNGIKVNSAPNAPQKKPEPVQKIDEEALSAAIEKRIRERLEKEMTEKFAAKFSALLENKSNSEPAKAPVNEKKVSETSKPVVKKPPTIVNLKPKDAPDKPKITRKEFEEFMAMKKREMQKKREMEQKSKPQKKPFHFNPYLDPPRRLLEPQRPHKPPPKRRIESDDDDDDEEDDMSDFIDDGPSQNEEDYSKYIKEIFGYDRSRYLDEDDEDIKETTFAEQMKEEIQSARVGYLEDLEEERKEMARKKKKKLKA